MMDVLEHLQGVQRVLQLMSEHGLCCDVGGVNPGNSSSDRFMAEFLLFLIQKAEDANELSEKCCVLMTRLPKVSLEFLRTLTTEKFMPGTKRRINTIPSDKCELKLVKAPPVKSARTEKKTCHGNDLHKSTAVGVTELCQSKTRIRNTQPSEGMKGDLLKPTADTPVVGLTAMERASTTLEDFCRSYFMFHGMNALDPRHLFKHLPILYYVEAVIYQFDEKNEELVQHQSIRPESSRSDSPDQSVLLSPVHETQHTTSLEHVYEQSFAKDSQFGGLKSILASRGLLTNRIESELKVGMEYWYIERKLGGSLMNGISIATEDVLRAIKSKSFDYRVLNLLLYALTGKEVNESHVEFLAVSELLVEISDDLFDYEDDVVKNSFNILRMLVSIYGPAEAPEILANIISNAETEYRKLLNGLEPSLAKQYEDRCRKATQEGGGASKYEFGSWTIPPIIVDEKKFRASLHA